MTELKPPEPGGTEKVWPIHVLEGAKSTQRVDKPSQTRPDMDPRNVRHTIVILILWVILVGVTVFCGATFLGVK